jgi:hypothetical protein
MTYAPRAHQRHRVRERRAALLGAVDPFARRMRRELRVEQLDEEAMALWAHKYTYVYTCIYMYLYMYDIYWLGGAVTLQHRELPGGCMPVSGRLWPSIYIYLYIYTYIYTDIYI